uniref:ANK_REP_REGION domain-containing protein n=1 Tax=Macrostomum lignano TaxID=282301 RepID=A0A1I8FEP2_9PLAT
PCAEVENWPYFGAELEFERLEGGGGGPRLSRARLESVCSAARDAGLLSQLARKEDAAPACSINELRRALEPDWIISSKIGDAQQRPRLAAPQKQARFHAVARDGAILYFYDETVSSLTGRRRGAGSGERRTVSMRYTWPRRRVTPLSCAKLLMRNADPDACTKKGNTALPHRLPGRPGGRGVKLLIEKDCQVARNGFTPLYMASRENHVDVVKFLLASAPRKLWHHRRIHATGCWRCSRATRRVVAILLRERQSRPLSHAGSLHVAAKKDDVRSATLLLTLAAASPRCTSPAHYGSLGVAALLIEKGADVNFQAWRGRLGQQHHTAAHVARKWACFRCGAERCCEHGAEVDCKTRARPHRCTAHPAPASTAVGRPALLAVNASFRADSRAQRPEPLAHLPLRGDHVDWPGCLLTRGANLDDTTIDLLTPLHVAAHCGYTRVAKLLLLDHRCMVNGSLNGFTPPATSRAKKESHPGSSTAAAASSFLRCRGGYGVRADAAARGPPSMGPQQRRVASAASTARTRLGNAEDRGRCCFQVWRAVRTPPARTNYTALHVGCQEGHEEVVATLLLDHKASHLQLQLTTKKGARRLHNAAKYDKAGVAKVLLSRGPIPNARGRNGLTPAASARALQPHGSHPHAAVEAKGQPELRSQQWLHLRFAHRVQKNHLDLGWSAALWLAPILARRESKSGFAPLHLAASRRAAPRCARSLLCLSRRRRCRPGIAQQCAFTPLPPGHPGGQGASQQRCWLLQLCSTEGRCGANALTQQQFTPLHVAAQQDTCRCVSLLLEAGAIPT